MSCWAQQVGTGGMRDKNLSQGCPHHHQPQQGTNYQHTHHSLPLIHGLDTLTQNQTLGVLHQTYNLPTLGALNPPTLTLGAQAPPTLILSQANSNSPFSSNSWSSNSSKSNQNAWSRNGWKKYKGHNNLYYRHSQS